MSACAEMPISKAQPHPAPQPNDQITLSRAAYEKLQAQAALAKTQNIETAACVSAESRVDSLQKELAAVRAGDPNYQRLQAKLADLQNRLNQSQQREADLRRKLNELIQIEKSAHLAGGR
ncbi:hypothetical protein [Candidatus Igneacidithiobacillus taiwanensis]|uniref:hypothetical protein n=2 Tax=Candidatus Igneacidithiobacillus taiwanensis TaxID=1945924 RepID=UPI00289766CA|nr:hypothetical protein [Candidatus Igneacidithiobacillus taiwanensis]